MLAREINHDFAMWGMRHNVYTYGVVAEFKALGYQGTIYIN
jgi:hypothetical protein